MTNAARPRLGRAAVQGTAWRYATFFSGKLLVFFSTAILARLLSQEDFGVVGYAVTTIGFLDALADLGIGPAVIFHRDEKETADTAFWLGLLIGAGLCGLTWLIAPAVGDFFRDARAVPVTRALGFTFFFGSLGNIHEARLRKQLAFGRNFVPEFIKALAKGVISVACALAGLGYWSLIIGQLVGTALASAAFWWVNPWRPSLRFAATRARSLLGYGLNIVGVDTLGILLLNADYLFVGRYLGAVALGVYTLAFRLPDLIILQFSRILSTVVFPVFTHMRDKPGALGRGFVRTTRYVALITFPLGLGVALLAQPFVNVAFSAKWADAVEVTRVIALYALLSALAYNAGSVYKAEGRPQVLTYIGLVRAVVLVPALAWAVLGPGTLLAVAWIQVAVAVISLILNLVIAARLLQTPVRDLANAVRPAFVAGAVMSLAVGGTLAYLSQSNDWAQLAVCTLVGAAVYVGSLALLERGLLQEAWHILQGALKRS